MLILIRHKDTFLFVFKINKDKKDVNYKINN